MICDAFSCGSWFSGFCLLSLLYRASPEIYILSQGSCGCVNATVPCGATAAKVAPAVDTSSIESFGTLTVMNEGQWYDSAIYDTYSAQYWAFDVPVALASSCPMIRFEMQIAVGTLSAFISAREIPTSGNYDFTRPFNAHSWMMICPSQPQFYYGRYYVNIANAAGRSTNIFRMRYTIVSSPTCLNRPTLPSAADQATAVTNSGNPTYYAASRWMDDGVTKVIASTSTTGMNFYKMYVPGRCTNMSVSLYRTVSSQDWPFLYLAANTMPIPSENTLAYITAYARMPEAWLDIIYCNPDPTATFNMFYIGVLGRTIGNLHLIATTDKYIPPIALSSLYYSQHRQELMYGAAPSLNCPTAQHICRYFGYRGCDAAGISQCCYHLNPAPAEEHVQTYWPWNAADTSIGQFHQGINWKGMQPLVPGKLAWGLAMEWSDSTTRTVNTDVDPSLCNMTIGRGFVNSKYEAFQTFSISFTEKKLSCDYDNYISVSNTIQNRTQGYIDGTAVDTSRDTSATPAAQYSGGKNTVAAVALQQLEIAIASWDDGYVGCQDLIFDRFANITETYNDTEAFTVCTHFPGTAAYLADACCNSALTPTISCRATVVPELLPITGTVRASAMESDTCANPQCAQSAVESLIYTDNSINDASTGCLASLDGRASVDEATDRLAFTYNCLNNLLDTDLLGMECNYTDDCRTMANKTYGVYDTNVTCVASTGRCDFTAANVISCMANQIDSDTAIGLFGQWGLSGKPTVETLTEQFTIHWLDKNLCVGPNAQQYRDGFRFTLLTPGCEDYCGYMNLEPYCVDTSKSRTDACPIPSVCDFSVNTSRAICWRNWQAIQMPDPDNGADCLASKVCNWRRNITYPCPYTSTADCTALCEDPALSEFVCADCSDDITTTCQEQESITDEATCNLGYCTTDRSITDPATCEASGVCTAQCASGCTQAMCESTGTCSDYNMFRSLADQSITGVCLQKRTFSSLTGSYSCPTGWTNEGWMCANVNATFNEALCDTTAGATWYEFATTPETCLSNTGYYCYQKSNGFWNYRNQSECNVCGDDCIWTTPFSWGNGNWTAGRIQELSWYKRAYVSRTSFVPAVNLQQATLDVNEAITRDFAYAYYTDALCRYDSKDDLVKSVVCDCNTTAQASCFENRNEAAIGAIQVCPYQYRSLATAVAIVTIPTTAATSQSSCNTVEVAETSVGKYQVPPDHSVTHALFKSINNNAYLVVVNDNNAIVGQLISDAATVSFTFKPDTPLQLCVLVQDFISIDTSLSHYMLARLGKDNAIVTYDDEGLAKSAKVSASEFTQNSTADGVRTSSVRRRVCGYIDESGTWFAVAVAKNYKDLTQNPKGEAIASACLYVALLVFCLIQSILLALDHAHQRLLIFKEVALAVISVNAAIRVAYVLLPSDHFKSGTESLQFILFEAPTFFCFSIFTVIVYLWAMVVLNTRQFGRRTPRTRVIRNLFILANVFMYAIFVVFIYLIAILPAKTAASPCFLGNLDSAITDVEKKIKIAYWIYQMVVAVALAVGFTICVIYLLGILISLKGRGGVRGGGGRARNSKSESSLSRSLDDDRGRGNGHAEHNDPAPRRDTSVDVQMIIITFVAFVCIVFLLVRAAIFLDVAVNSTTLHVIVFCILEVVPQAMLVFYMHPFRCFREAGRRSSTRSNSGGPSYTRTQTYTKSSGRSSKGGDTMEMRDEDPAPKSNGHSNGHANGKVHVSSANGKPSRRNPASAVPSSSGTPTNAPPRRTPNKGAKPIKSRKTDRVFTNTSDDEGSSSESSESRSDDSSLGSSSP